MSGEPAYQVRYERRRESWFLGWGYYLYLAGLLPFLAWRCAIVNWHIWLGPVALAADLFAAMMFVFFIGFTRYLYLPVHRPADPWARTVDCLIPTHTEPVSVVEPTVLAALRVRGIRRVLVLGNSDRPDVGAMATRLGAEYHARNSNAHGKAGNLNNGLSLTEAEFVLTMDADHMALPQILERTMGYFDDPSVAFVQTPQSFHNTKTLLFRRAYGEEAKWSESNVFYKTILPAKNGCNASIYVGTSAVLRRAALDDVGGFATGTVTEDIHTSLRMHANGWRSVFVPEPQAFGLEAQNLKEFYKQRRRWAIGALTLLLRSPDSPLRRRGLTLRQRLSYIDSTLSHLGGVQRLIHFLLPALTIFLLGSPVVIPFALYGLAFVCYFLVSFTMVAVYSRGTYHFLHSDAYSLANLVAQVSALPGLLRRARRQNAARKDAPHRERTTVKAVLWLLGLSALGGVADGLARYTSGNHSWLVIMATFWGLVNSVWMWWILGYLEVYERRPTDAGAEELTALDRYQLIVDRFGRQAELPVTAGTSAATRSNDTVPNP
jgi:cellulose synthase/poly-beta-1,6-N-acetylglucosamine synthase-like glycosyltransferase